MNARTWTVNDLRRAAKSFGATVEDHSSPRRTEYQVLAPAGKVWSCTGDIHYLIVMWHGSGKPVWPEEKQDGLADILGRMSEGLTDCDDPDCDWCHSGDDEEA